jgi:DNA-binding NtrC family response regulator
MATVLVVGSDEALLEGLAQSLAYAGHAGMIAHSAMDAVELAAAQAPLAVVAEHAIVSEHPELAHVPLLAGGALILYHGSDEAPASVPGPVQRLVMAELSLPLERARLLALLQRIDERARATGRQPGHPEAPDRMSP